MTWSMAAAGIILAFASLPTAAAVLVKNGSFETPPAPAGNLDRYSTGQNIGRWNVVGASGTVDVISSTYQYEGVSFPARSGKQWLDLTGASQTQTGVAQSIATTIGTTYTLTFFVGNVYDPNTNLGVDSTVMVSVDGKTILTAKNADRGAGMTFIWKKFSTSFKATKARTVLQFINLDPSNDTCNGLDSVSLVASK